MSYSRSSLRATCLIARKCNLVTCVPSWFPGGAWKRKIPEYARTFNDTVELPYRWVKEQMVCASTQSAFTGLLLRLT